MRLGNSYYKSKNFSGSINAYESSININKENFESVSNLGLAYFFNNNFEKSVTTFKRSLEIKPENYQAWLMIAVSLANLGQYKAAISY